MHHRPCSARPASRRLSTMACRLPDDKVNEVTSMAAQGWPKGRDIAAVARTRKNAERTPHRPMVLNHHHAGGPLPDAALPTKSSTISRPLADSQAESLPPNFGPTQRSRRER
jgi:hypothetical protein